MVDKIPTEEKIKQAARKVFTQKGYAATRTRDIAEESGYNLALLNYYFRSKEKLFEIVMLENAQMFIHSMLPMFNNPDIALLDKITILADKYIDMLVDNPDMPLFMFGVLRDDPQGFINKVMGSQEQPRKIVFAMQWMEFAAKNKVSGINPIHFLMNLMGLIVFPFIASPLIRNRTGMSLDEYKQLMMERKKLIPVWIKQMILTPPHTNEVL